MALVIRTKADPLAVIGDVRRQIAGIDRDAGLTFQPLRREMSKTILRPRVSLAIMAAFAIVALITAAFGLYGLISYRVNQRQQEIGMRLALGAPPGSVRWAVQKRCLMLVCAGLAAGMPLAYGLSMLMKIATLRNPADAACGVRNGVARLRGSCACRELWPRPPGVADGSGVSDPA